MNDQGSIEAFFAREKSNEGIVLPLSYPNGDPSPYWLRVVGISSDVFRKQDLKARRKIVELAKSAEGKEVFTDEKAEELRLESIAALVIGWNLNTTFSQDNVVKLLREAPQLAKEIDRIAGDERRFFVKTSESSSPSPSQSST